MILATAVLGVHLASYHLNPELSGDRPYNDVNPGLYLRTEAGWQAGYYWNSHRKSTVYVGRAFTLVSGQRWDAGFFVAAATGYPWGEVVPLVAASVRYRALRITATPPVGDKASGLVHASLEWRM